jgi:hypothetical protein
VYDATVTVYEAVKPQPATELEKGTFGQPKPSNKRSATSSNKQLIYSEFISVDELRFKRLLKERKVFGIASLMVLAGLIAAAWAGIPYEPFAAMLFCVLGIFVVFAMKVRDAQR